MKSSASRTVQSGFFTVGLAMVVLAIAGTSVAVVETGEQQEVADSQQQAPVAVASVETVNAD
jgi:hypothetical protein